MNRAWLLAVPALLLVPAFGAPPGHAQGLSEQQERAYRLDLHNARTIQERRQIEDRHRQDMLQAERQGTASVPSPQPAWGTSQSPSTPKHPKYGVGVLPAFGGNAKSKNESLQKYLKERESKP